MKYLIISISLIASVPFQAHAGRESGGGAQIEGAFRMRAYELINSIAISPKANELCGADFMKSSLRATRIRVVDELVDPLTGILLSDQNLDAWTIPGDMQLLKASWIKFLDPANARIGKSIDILILHEAYRATGGKCDDEGFKISDHILALFNQPTMFSQVFALTGKQEPRFSNHNTHREHSTYCNAEIVDGSHVICGILYPVGSAQREYEFHLVQGHVDLSLVREHLAIAMRPLTVVEFQQLANLLAFASPKNPFFVVFDIQTGGWSYGFDLANLIKLP